MERFSFFYLETEQKVDIKPIETVWRGYRFRSRLEARWAVFFSSLGLHWEYEPEGFELGDGLRYLPDFRVSGRDTNGDDYEFWVEVKPENYFGNDLDREKHRKFAAGIQEKYLSDFLLCSGLPRWCWYDSQKYDDHNLVWRLWGRRKRPWFEVIPNHTLSDEWFRGECYHDALSRECGRPARDFENALNAARAARFEHGEVPA